MTARRSFKVCSSCFSCWRVMFNVGDVLNEEVEELIERPERVRCFMPLPLALTPNVLVPLLVTVGVMKQDEGLFSAFALRWFMSVDGVSFTFSSERVADAARRRNAANITVCLQLENKGIVKMKINLQDQQPVWWTRHEIRQERKNDISRDVQRTTTHLTRIGPWQIPLFSEIDPFWMTKYSSKKNSLIDR